MIVVIDCKSDFFLKTEEVLVNQVDPIEEDAFSQSGKMDEQFFAFYIRAKRRQTKLGCQESEKRGRGGEEERRRTLSEEMMS